jgi:hypothetical protein
MDIWKVKGVVTKVKPVGMLLMMLAEGINRRQQDAIVCFQGGRRC